MNATFFKDLLTKNRTIFNWVQRRLKVTAQLIFVSCVWMFDSTKKKKIKWIIKCDFKDLIIT